jgi:hypothetical protein
LTPGSGIRDRQKIRIRIRDPDLRSRYRINNPDHISQSLKTIFWVKILKVFDADPGWKKFGSGINIPDPQDCLDQKFT